MAGTASQGLACAISDIRRGDNLVVYKLDRIGCSVAYIGALLRYLDEMDVGVFSVSEGIDTRKPEWANTYVIVNAMAVFMRELSGEQTVRGAGHHHSKSSSRRC